MYTSTRRQHYARQMRTFLHTSKPEKVQRTELSVARSLLASFLVALLVRAIDPLLGPQAADQTGVILSVLIFLVALALCLTNISRVIFSPRR